MKVMKATIFIVLAMVPGVTGRVAAKPSEDKVENPGRLLHPHDELLQKKPKETPPVVDEMTNETVTNVTMDDMPDEPEPLANVTMDDMPDEPEPLANVTMDDMPDEPEPLANVTMDDMPDEPEPLATAVTESGGSVEFFQPTPGMVAMVSAGGPGDTMDPLFKYMQELDDEPFDVGVFYTSLTGEEPPEELAEAIHLSKEGLDGVEEQDQPPIDESYGDIDVQAVQAEQAFGSTRWWYDNYCSWTARYDWCNCWARRTGVTFRERLSNEFFQRTYAYRGDVRAELYWRRRTSDPWIPFRQEDVRQGEAPKLLTAIGRFYYRGTVTQSFGDGYHVVYYDPPDSVISACRDALGVGCYVCWNRL